MSRSLGVPLEVGGWFSFPGSAWERTVCEALPRVLSNRQAEPARQCVPRQSLGTRNPPLPHFQRFPFFRHLTSIPEIRYNPAPPTADKGTDRSSGIEGRKHEPNHLRRRQWRTPHQDHYGGLP